MLARHVGRQPSGEMPLMRKIFGFVGATAGGWIGWSLGAGVGIMTAFLLSIVGTGVGLYAGYRAAARYS